MEHEATGRATLSEAEAARYLGVSEITLFRRRRDGTLPFLRIGRRVVYRHAALDAWLSSAERNSVGGVAVITRR